MWLRLSIPLQLFHITFGQTGCGMRVVTSKPNSIKCEIPFNQKLDVKSDFLSPHPLPHRVGIVLCAIKQSKMPGSVGLAW